MADLFEGERIRLRPFEPDDASAVRAYLNRPGMAARRYIPWEFPDVTPLSRGQAESIVQKWAQTEKGLCLAIERLDTGELIGHAEGDWDWDPHCPSVSVTIDPAHQRQRFGSEAMRMLLRYLFEYTVAHTVACWIADWNEAGLQFAQRHGFQTEGHLRRVGIRGGRAYNLVITGMLRSEWVQTGGREDAS